MTISKTTEMKFNILDLLLLDHHSFVTKTKHDCRYHATMLVQGHLLSGPKNQEIIFFFACDVRQRRFGLGSSTFVEKRCFEKRRHL